MTRPALTPTAIQAACEELGARDAALFKAYTLGGLPKWRDVDTGFESLARIVVYQLLSTRAAGTIWGRLIDAFGGQLEAAQVAQSSLETLRGVGLSNAKAKCLHGVAEAVASGALCLDFTNNTENPRDSLLNLRGVGPWTANIYCMNALKDMDAFPVGDVGLMEAYRMLRGDPERMDAKTFNARAVLWSPYQGVAAHLLWAWINASRGLKPED